MTKQTNAAPPPGPRIELRKVTYNERLSEETNAYKAEIWVDGRLLCTVTNAGHGGADSYEPAKGRTYPEISALDKYITEHYPAVTGHEIELPNCLELVCGELLADWIARQDLQRMLKRTIVFQNPGAKISYIKGRLDAPAKDKARAQVLAKNRDAVVLNDLPFDQALAIYVQQTV